MGSSISSVAVLPARGPSNDKPKPSTHQTLSASYIERDNALKTRQKVLQRASSVWMSVNRLLYRSESDHRSNSDGSDCATNREPLSSAIAVRGHDSLYLDASAAQLTSVSSTDKFAAGVRVQRDKPSPTALCMTPPATYAISSIPEIDSAPESTNVSLAAKLPQPLSLTHPSFVDTGDGEGFSTRKAYRPARNANSSINRNYCDICRLGFSSQSELQDHANYSKIHHIGVLEHKRKAHDDVILKQALQELEAEASVPSKQGMVSSSELPRITIGTFDVTSPREFVPLSTRSAASSRRQSRVSMSKASMLSSLTPRSSARDQTRRLRVDSSPTTASQSRIVGVAMTPRSQFVSSSMDSGLSSRDLHAKTVRVRGGE